MANTPQRNAQMAELAAVVVAQDKVLKDELSGLVRDIIKHQRLVMRAGSPADKAALVKAVLPQMLAAMNTVAQDEAAAAETAAIDRMYAMLRGETTATPALRVAP